MRIRFYRDLSIKRKLTLVILLTGVIVLVLVSTALVTYDVLTLRRTMAQDLKVLAEVLGRNCTAALSFEDQTSGTETLSALAAEPHIISARLYRLDGKSFAEYVRGEEVVPYLAGIPPEGTYFGNDRLDVCVGIVLNEKRIGRIYVRSDLGVIHDRLTSYGLISAVVTVLVVMVTFALSPCCSASSPDRCCLWPKRRRRWRRGKIIRSRAHKESSDEIGL